MGKNSPSFVLKTVFKDISNIESVIKASKKIQQNCDKVDFGDKKEVQKIIEDTKTFITSLTAEVTKINEYFDENYQAWANEPKKVSLATEEPELPKEPIETCVSGSGGGNGGDVEQKSNKDDKVQESNKGDVEHLATKTNDKECTNDITSPETENGELCKGKGKSKVSAEPENGEEINEESALTGKETVDDINSQDSNDSTNKDSESITSLNLKKHNLPDSKVFLKCVDINKLIKPIDVVSRLPSKSVKRVSINDSVLIISDSEGECDNNISKRNALVTVKSAKKKYKSSANVSMEKSKKKHVSISSGSDSESFKLKNNCLKQNKKSKSDDHNEKTNRPRSFRKKRKTEKNLMKDESLSDTSSFGASSSSDSSEEVIKKVPKNSQSKEKAIIKRDKKDKLILNAQSDKKFSCEAYVPLPRIPCEKLKEIYLTKNEINEIKRLTNLKSLSKRNRKKNTSANNTSSSDTENNKPKRKRPKKIVDKSDSLSESSDVDDHALNDHTLDDAISSTAPNKGLSDEAVEMILDGIKSGTDSSTAASGDEVNEKADKKKKHEKKAQDVEDNKAKDDSKEEKSSIDSSEEERKKEKKIWRKNKLLTSRLSGSDSEEEVKIKTKKDVKSRKFKKKIKNVIDSDSDDGKKPDSSSDESEESHKKSKSSDSDVTKNEIEEESEKKTRRRIKRVKDSSSDENTTTRKSIRKMIAHDSLTEATKQAEKDEKERKARIAERQKKYNQIFDENKPLDATIDKLVLDFEEDTKKELLSVNKDLVKKLKPHQAKGVQFMWDACYESLERTKNTNGSGCILAHCMGLGKTLQVITLVHTLIANQELTNVHKVLVVCPVNTVLNWVSEFNKWLDDIEGPEIDVYDLVSSKQNTERKYQVEEWSNDGGVMVIGYDMFRNLTNPTNKRLRKSQREAFYKGLVDPGSDLVICDEGHLLKNEKSNLSVAMNRIRTVRRIVLTGTPMQNNLKEYYCMVQFVKPNLLGTYREYLNRFVNPITNGQYTDSTEHDINIMRKRSHVLHKMLDGVVQRKDYSVLLPYLPPKYEYVLFLTLTEMQIKLYEHYLTERSKKPPADTKMRTSFLFIDFQEFQRICTHPRVLLNKSIENNNKQMWLDDDSEGSLKDFIDDGSDEKSSSSSSSDDDSKSDSVQSISSTDGNKESKSKPGQRMTRNSAAAQGIDVEVPEKDDRSNEWWSQFCTDEQLDDIALSSKLYLLFEILQQCELIGDKLLVFSQSLYSLDIIEYFLGKIEEATQKGENENVCGFSGSWAIGLDYFRLDGSSSCDNRSAWCKCFNNPDNSRARLFLISTRAGGLGINLVGANRVVIFDVSWNPSHDIQSIYRIYRFGQTKPCYIYRFVTNGTMEMKIYERQVTKQAISKRVIDEQQIDRHYNQNDLTELYKFDPKPEEQPIPLIPKDVLLAELLQSHKDRIFKYHEHQSLLENKEDEELDEAERKAAWEEYENEKTARVNMANSTGGWIKNLPISSVTLAMGNIVRKDNPTWTQPQVQAVVPVLVQQLQEQVDSGEMQLFNRIINELKLLQAAQQQRLREYYMQQQIHLLQQHMTQQNMGMQQQGGRGRPRMNYNFPVALQSAMQNPNPPLQITEIVELND